MTQTADVIIIGGGAAGLTAAIFAAQSGGASRRIILLEGSKTLGTKILVSGGGRCNVTHENVTPNDFNAAPNIVRNILAGFDAPAAVRWFASLGVPLKREETGKLYPVSDSARTVVNALVARCRELGVTIVSSTRVQKIIPPGPIGPAAGLFQIEHDQGTILAGRVILATGGRSLPKSGSDGYGWELARQLGHTVTLTHQALTPLVLDAAFFHAGLSGIALEVELSTVVQSKPLDRRVGSMLFTHFGISGPVVLDASRHWVIAQAAGQRPQLLCNLLMPDTFQSAEAALIAACSNKPRTSIGNLLAGRLPERVALAVLGHSHVDPSTPAGQVSRDARRHLVHLLTALPLPVVHPRGWEYAEVTAGGIPLAEIDYRTMQSRKVPGLYLAGEILDCDGRIGGFNFQWAWSTGHLAGSAAAR